MAATVFSPKELMLHAVDCARYLMPRCWLVIGVCMAVSACTLPQADFIKQLDAQIALLADPKPPYVDGVVYKNTLFSEVALDLYLPYGQDEPSVTRHPVYIYVHGGSWMHGHRKLVRLVDKRIETLRQNGIAVISIDYRKLQQAGIGGATDDARASLDWLLNNATKYQLDTHNVVVHGASAGGHLALMMGFSVSHPELEIKLILDDFGPADLVALQHQQKGGGPNLLQLYPNSRLRALSPMTYIKSGLPPVYIIHARGDDLVPLSQSEALVAALRAKGNTAELEVLEISGADHGFRGTSEAFNRELDIKRTQKVLSVLLQGTKLSGAMSSGAMSSGAKSSST